VVENLGKHRKALVSRHFNSAPTPFRFGGSGTYPTKFQGFSQLYKQQSVTYLFLALFTTVFVVQAQNNLTNYIKNKLISSVPLSQQYRLVSMPGARK